VHLPASHHRGGDHGCRRLVLVHSRHGAVAATGVAAAPSVSTSSPPAAHRPSSASASAAATTAPATSVATRSQRRRRQQAALCGWECGRRTCASVAPPLGGYGRGATPTRGLSRGQLPRIHRGDDHPTRVRWDGAPPQAAAACPPHPRAHIHGHGARGRRSEKKQGRDDTVTRRKHHGGPLLSHRLERRAQRRGGRVRPPTTHITQAYPRQPKRRGPHARLAQSGLPPTPPPPPPFYPTLFG